MLQSNIEFLIIRFLGKYNILFKMKEKKHNKNIHCSYTGNVGHPFQCLTNKWINSAQ